MRSYPIVLCLVVAAGCSGPPVGAVRDAGSVEETGADVVLVDASGDTGGRDVVDAAPPDAPGDAGGADVVDASLADVASDVAVTPVDASTDAGGADVDDVTTTDVASDTGSSPLDVPVDTGVDAGVDVAAPDAGPPDAGPPDAGPPDAGPPDAGPPVMRFEFVSGTPVGSAGGVSMRSTMVWHGRHRGSGGGINYEGWFQ